MAVYKKPDTGTKYAAIFNGASAFDTGILISGNFQCEVICTPPTNTTNSNVVFGQRASGSASARDWFALKGYATGWGLEAGGASVVTDGNAPRQYTRNVNHIRIDNTKGMWIDGVKVTNNSTNYADNSYQYVYWWIES